MTYEYNLHKQEQRIYRMVFVYTVAWIAKSLSDPGQSDDFQSSVHPAIKVRESRRLYR